MNSPLLSRTRRWIGASSLALVVAIGSGSALVLSGQPASAQIDVERVAPASFADLVEAVKPAVVSINVAGVQRVQQPNFDFRFPDLPEDHPFRRFFDQFGDQFEGPNGRAPRERRFQAAGSGFIISEDGYVVTNNHVVQDADEVTVVDEQGNEHPAQVIGTDERTDIALLKIDDAQDLPYVEFADEDVRVGDWVVAVGNPFGLGGTVTAGIVSARGRDIAASSYGDFIQIDAAVNRGNSGGPAFNLDGKVIGVNTAIFSPSGGNVGIAFAVPAQVARMVVNDLMDDGQVTRGFLGVQIQDLSRDIADSVGLDTAHGALVTQPSEGSPAARAGIRSGDVILQVDGEQIDNALDLSRTIAGKEPGTAVNLTIWRNGERQEVSVTLDTLDEEAVAQAPEQDRQAEPDLPQQTSVGLSLVPNADGEGALIQAIDPDSIAATKGLAVGDVILEADNTAISNTADFEAAIENVRDSGRSTVLLKLSRNGNIRFVGLPLDE